MSEGLKNIPAVESILQEPAICDFIEAGDFSRSQVVGAVRSVVEGIRRAILACEAPATDSAALAQLSIELLVRNAKPKLVRVVNASGIVLHTNLGRAPLGASALAAMREASGYCCVEYDLERGERGSRMFSVEGLLRQLTGAEAALVVNNNAAAVLLVLTALAKGREVVVSRGELVEIGGSFRIPDVMAQSGAILKEVGATNKTHLRDYERVVGPNTAALLKVHASNYKIVGFTSAVPLDLLVSLGRRNGVAVIQDLGSGCLTDLGGFGILGEPTVQKAVENGADIITFSGDKLLGGPQAGIIVGKREAVAACASHPLFRALRLDKISLAALEAVLSEYRNPEKVISRVPVLAMLAKGVDQLQREADFLAAKLASSTAGEADVSVIEGFSEAGGGSLPSHPLPTRLVSVRPKLASVARIERLLRCFEPPVVARVHRDAILFDPRTLCEGDVEIVAAALAMAFSAK